MRFLLTAGAGFIGSELCDHLADAGHDVVCLDRADRLARLERRRADVTYDEHVLGAGSASLDRVEGCDAVLHLAHRGLPSSPPSEVAADSAANLSGALELLEAARRHGTPRVVFASSGGTVYGRVDALPATEDTPLAPISAYGASKVEVEQALDDYSREHGVRTVSLRVGNAVGAGQFRGAGVGAPAKFLADVAAGRSLQIWGDGTTVRDYLDVEDIVDAFVRASTLAVPDGAYNVGSGRGISLTGIVDLVRTVTGREIDLIHHEAREFDVPSIVLDHSRFSAASGWAPTVGLDVTLRRMWDTISPSNP